MTRGKKKRKSTEADFPLVDVDEGQLSCSNPTEGVTDINDVILD